MYGAIHFMKIHGISLFIHWTFLLLTGLVIFVNVQQGNNLIQMAWSVLFILAVFACVTLHEFGHALVAAAYGIRAKHILLLPVGGIASIEKFPDNPGQELLISMAGPATNLLIAALLWMVIQQQAGFINFFPDTNITEGKYFFLNLYMINVGLAIFNLIPAFPMDGGRILRALLAFRLNYLQATSIAAATGRIIAVIFIALGIVLVNFILPLVGIFIVLSANTEEFYLRLKFLVKGIKIKDMAIHDYHVLNAHMTILEAADILKMNYSKYFILAEGTKPVGSISRIEIMKALAEKKYSDLLIETANPEINCLEGEEDVDIVLEQLAGHEDYVYPVVVNNYYTGAINLNQVIEYLLLHKTDSKQYKRVMSLAGLLR